MRDVQNEKRDHHHSPPSEVEGVRIVVISFRNIAKNVITQKRIKKIKINEIMYQLKGILPLMLEFFPFFFSFLRKKGQES